MIECFLHEHAYYFTDGHKRHRFFKAKRNDTLWSIYNDYNRNYLMLISLLGELRRDDEKNIIIYHNSRIIEEIDGTIEPINEWGRSILVYIRRNVLPYFIDCMFRKRSVEDILEYIADGKKKLSAYEANYDREQAISNSVKRRIQRFKNEGQKRRCEER